MDDISPAKFRAWRIKLIPLLGLYVLVKHFPFVRGEIWTLGYRVFWATFLVLLFGWWRMEKADARFLAEQEAKAAQDPKHLYDNSTGLRANPRERTIIVASLFVMGVALLFQAQPSSDVPMIFWGAGLCLLASFIWGTT